MQTIKYAIIEGRTKAANVTGPDEGPVQGENEQRTEGEEASEEAKAVRTS